MNLKVGVLTGTTIFGHGSSDGARDQAIFDLNQGDLDGLIMTDRVGGCGHNLTGASVMIFMGSLYSKASEDQVTGDFPPFVSER